MEINIIYNIARRYPRPENETKIFDPFNDIYPNSYGALEPDAPPLAKAIYWLQQHRVEYLIATGADTTEIICLNSENVNYLEMLCYGTNYKYEYNTAKILSIAKILCEANPNLVTTTCFTALYHFKYNKLTDLLLNYSIDTDDMCYFCLKTEPKYCQLRSVCLCKNPIHIGCFQEMYEKNKSCIICCKQFVINQDNCHTRQQIFFPFDDFYPVPLFEYVPLVKRSGIEQIKYALCYAQPNRLQNLFDTLPKKVIVEYFKSENFHKGFGNVFDSDHYGVIVNNYYRIKSLNILKRAYCKFMIKNVKQTRCIKSSKQLRTRCITPSKQTRSHTRTQTRTRLRS